MGNIPALMETMKNAVGAGEGKRDSTLMANRLLQGGFTLRDLYEQMTTILKVGSFYACVCGPAMAVLG
jgi:signal recognition particle GTPase